MLVALLLHGTSGAVSGSRCCPLSAGLPNASPWTCLASAARTAKTPETASVPALASAVLHAADALAWTASS